MALPLKYNFRNVFVRWRATLATVLGVALVVAVFVLVQSLAVGLEKSSQNTGDPRNVMVARKGSTAESSSQVTREQYRTVMYLAEIARDERGQPLVSADVVILVNLPRRSAAPDRTSLWYRMRHMLGPDTANTRSEATDSRAPALAAVGGGLPVPQDATNAPAGEANVTLRGVTPRGMLLRPQVTLVEGRWFEPGKREAVVSRKVAQRFANCHVGGRIRTGGTELTIVGWMDGSNSAFDSEIWMDADEARSAFNRANYSSLLIRAADTNLMESLIARIEADKRAPLRAEPEIAYYSAQTRTAGPIRILGGFLATTMSIGAIFAAMNTMYASVGSRTREIGTLRVLGYRRRSIMLGFVIEGVMLASIGGALGCLLALPMHGYSTGTMSFDSFSEVVFQFRITPWLAAQGMVFAMLVGFAGSLLPAARAARLPVIAALKAV